MNRLPNETWSSPDLAPGMTPSSRAGVAPGIERCLAFCFVLATTLLLAVPLAAQAPPGPPQEPTELVFEREVFDYPTFERRNPFRPLVGDTGSGPRFEQIRLRGIIWSTDPAGSVALFQASAAGGAANAPAASRRLRRGETWGNMRVVEIQRDLVVVDVEEFGLTERRTLELTRRRAEGG